MLNDLVYLQLPEILDPQYFKEAEEYDDYKLLTYRLPKAMPIEDLVDYFDSQIDLSLCYYHIPSRSTNYGRSCCAYSIGHMFKINALTDDNGLCSDVYVTVYESLEYLYSQLREDIGFLGMRGMFAHCRKPEEITADFC
jgi:hypothetical protein